HRSWRWAPTVRTMTRPERSGWVQYHAPGHLASAEASPGEGSRCAGATTASTYSRSPNRMTRHASKAGIRSSTDLPESPTLDGADRAPYVLQTPRPPGGQLSPTHSQMRTARVPRNDEPNIP